MAGAGRKTFSAGSVLTASDVMNYLQDQAVMVFGGTAARSSAIPSPSEGMVTYRTDDNALEYYDGASWTSALNPTVNNQTGTTYTFVATDNGKLVTANNSSSQTFTIPPQTSVAWPSGAILSVISYGTGTVTFAGGVGVTVTNTANTLSQYQGASLVRTGSDAWTVIPLSGGANALSDASVTGTTGSPSTATYAENGISYKTYAFTGSGSITVNRSGLVDVLVVSGGGSSGTGYGGGGGSTVISQTLTLPVGSSTVTVGAGAAATSGGRNGLLGNPSAIGVGTNTYLTIGIGGGGGGSDNSITLAGMPGGTGGGGGNSVGVAGGQPYISSLGFAGGTGNSNAGGGGGGASAVGTNAGGNGPGGNGGAGVSSTLRTGSSVTYGGGGGGGAFSSPGTGGAGGGGNAGNAGTANTGGGAGGSQSTGYNGGSGIVVIRVRA